MRALLVATDFNSNKGGLALCAVSFANYLLKCGYEVVVISSQPEDLENVPGCIVLNSRVEITSYNHAPNIHRKLFLKAHFKTLSQIIDRKKMVVFAFGAGENALFASWFLNEGDKFVVMLRGSEVNLSSCDSNLYFSNKMALLKADLITGISRELISNAKNIYDSPSAKYQVIPNAFNKNVIEGKSTSLNSDKTIVLGTGSYYLNEKKGILNLLHAIKIFKEEYSMNFNLELAGRVDPDIKEKYLKFVNENDLTKTVFFLGGLSRQEFIKIQLRWDIVIQASFFEGCPNSILEALLDGKLVLTTPTGFIAEQLSSLAPQLVFPNYDPHSIAESINDIIKNPEANLIRKKAIKHLSIQLAKETVEHVWDSCLKDIWDTGKISQKIISKCGISPHVNAVLFHDLGEAFGPIETPLDKLKKYSKHLYENGYRFCSAQDYLWSKDKSNLIVCTFDDAYENIHKYALPILSMYSFTATVFVLSDFIGKSNTWNTKDSKKREHMSMKQLEELKNKNWEIGSHGCDHNSLLRLSVDEIEYQLLNSKNQLESNLGPVNAFAYPYGHFNEFIINLTKRHYELAFATDQGGNHIKLDRFQLRRYNPELLISTIKK